MANNRINKYIGAITLGTVLMVVPGCTDTWDDHYSANGNGSEATLTLWEQIKNNPDYSLFSEILEQAKYYKDNTHAVDYTYKDIFEGRQVNTVFAPNNDAIKEFMKTDLYKKWKESLEKGESRAEDVVNSAGYNFQQQFIGNHIALWRRNISGDGIDTLRMINGMNLEFDKTKRRSQGFTLLIRFSISLQPMVSCTAFRVLLPSITTSTSTLSIQRMECHRRS